MTFTCHINKGKNNMNEENNKEVFQCICGKQFDNSKSLSVHKGKCKIYQAELQKIKQQELESRRLPNGMFKCENPDCGKEHDGSYASGRFCCEKCRRHYTSLKSNLTAIKNGNKHCPKNFKTPHAEYGRWKCARCNLIFETRALLFAHNHEVHPVPKGSSWNKGLTKNIDERVAKNGKHVSESFKQSIKNGYVNPSWTNVYWTKEKRKEQSERKKKLYAEHPEKHPNVKMNLKGFISKPEKLTKHWLIEHNIDYIPQYRVLHEDLIRYVDFYIPHFYLFIEIDGSYWHKDTKDLDEKKDLLAKKYGFKTLRISDTEDIKKCLSEYFNMI